MDDCNGPDYDSLDGSFSVSACRFIPAIQDNRNLTTSRRLAPECGPDTKLNRSTPGHNSSRQAAVSVRPSPVQTKQSELPRAIPPRETPAGHRDFWERRAEGSW